MYVDENFSNYGNYDGFVLSMHFPFIVKKTIRDIE